MCASVKKAAGEYAMGMLPVNEVPPNGVDPETWAEVISSAEKLQAVSGMEKGYPMIIYRDQSGIYFRANSITYRLLSAELKVQTIGSGGNSFTLSFRG